MKRLQLTVLLSLLFSITFGQGINFTNKPWAEVLKEAAAQDKYIFVDAITSWCGPCKMMAANVFPEKQVSEFYNKNFICVQLDMEKEGDGKNIAKNYEVKGYPTFLFFNSQGELVHRGLGYHDLNGMLSMGWEAITPDRQYYTRLKTYDRFKSDPNWVLDFAKFTSDAGLSADAFVADYISITNEGFWRMPDQWMKIMEVEVPFTSPLYAFGWHHKNELNHFGGPDDMYNFLQTPRQMFIMQAVVYPESTLQGKKATIKEVLGEHDAIDMIAQLEAYWHRQHGTKDAKVIYENYLDNHCINWEDLNSEVWAMIEENVKDKMRLNKGMTWIDKSIQINRNYSNLDTKAWLLYRMEKTDEARAVAMEAIDQAKKIGRDYSGTTELLEKLKG